MSVVLKDGSTIDIEVPRDQAVDVMDWLSGVKAKDVLDFDVAGSM